MYPTLFPSDNITASLGLGKLVETISCTVTEEINGEYSLELQYPITGSHYDELLAGGVIQVISPSYTNSLQTPQFHRQWFDVYKHSLPIDGVVTFYANHVSRRLSWGVFHGTQVDGDHVPYIWGVQASPSSPYGGMSFGFGGENPASGLTLDVSEPKSPLAVLIGSEESLVAKFGGEMAFDCNPVNAMSCAVYYNSRRGADRGVEIRHGFNLTELQKTRDTSGTYNAVVPFWDDGEGNRKYYSNIYIVQPTVPITPIKAVPLDASSYFETQPTDEQLVTFARNHLDQNQPWLGEESLTVGFINGQEIDTHAAPIVIGDTVRVYWEDGRINAQLRVVSYVYDVLSDRYAELRLGTRQTQFVAVTGSSESYAGSSGGGGGGGGVPDGGTTGQVLTKNSDANQDTVWAFPAEEGANYIKFPNGTLICWGVIGNGTPVSQSSFGALYSAIIRPNYRYPIPFIGPPCVSASNNGGVGGVFEIDTTATTLTAILIARQSNAPLYPKIGWTAIGRWK